MTRRVYTEPVSVTTAQAMAAAVTILRTNVDQPCGKHAGRTRTSQ